MFILLAQNEPKGQPFTWPAIAGFPALFTKNGRHRKVAIAPPGRLSVLRCTARLREMAFLKKLLLLIQKTPFRKGC